MSGRVQRAKGGAKQLIFNRNLKIAQKERSSMFKETPAYQALFDFPLMNLVKRLQMVKKQYRNIAFVGPNPYLFIQHLPKDLTIEKFYFCESSEAQVQKSYEIIESRSQEGGLYDKKGCNVPQEIIPVVLGDEGDPNKWKEKFQDSSLDLIVSNSSLHWVNDLEGSLTAYRESLIPDGVFLASAFGGETLQELRICLNLAESEREGGVSPIVSPMLSLTDMGNIFSRSGKFNMPTVDVQHTQLEFTSTFQLFQFLRETGEQNCLNSKRKHIPEQTFIAAAALYETLFNKQTIGMRDENTMSVLIDTFKEDYLHPDIVKSKQNNILATLDLIFLIGWRYDASQPKPLERGSAKFSLKDVVEEMNEKEDEGGDNHKIKYGVIIDDGDNIIEKDK